MPIAEEDTPRKKKVHESAKTSRRCRSTNSSERIAMLQDEIARLEEAIAAKHASATAADYLLQTLRKHSLGRLCRRGRNR